MFPIQVCEPCVENGIFKVGVYRDWIGQVLCDACDDARRLEFNNPVTSAPVMVAHTHDALMKREG